MGLRFFGFQNSGLFNGPANALPTAQTKPFLPWTAVSKFFCPSTRIVASRDIDDGAAVLASAISASRSIRYCSMGAMTGYGGLLFHVVAAFAFFGHAPPVPPTQTQVAHAAAPPLLVAIEQL